MDILRSFAADTATEVQKMATKTGAEDNLMETIGNIIRAVLGVVGVISGVMIIIGGISYATSQGDANKVKKGKDTILYGIIGLAISLLAFAIVTAVLSGMNSGTMNTTTTP